MKKNGVRCDTITCRYYENERCTKNPVLKMAKCQTFKVNYLHYVVKFLVAMGDSNFLPEFALDEDIRYGAYFAMKVFNLGMCESSHGNWTFYSFYRLDDENKTNLTANDIMNLPQNREEVIKITVKLDEGILPPYDEDKEKLEAVEKENKEKLFPFKDKEPLGYGFLDRQGTFYPVDFGNHESFALSKLEEKNWLSDYINNYNNSMSATDYLVEQKGWVLLHNPYSFGETKCQYSSHLQLTKKQKEFLYDYYMCHKDIKTAEFYLNF